MTPAPSPKPAARRRQAATVLGAVLALAAAALFPGCATNPATGESMMSFISPEEEARIGAREHRKLVPAFGGAITDKDLQRYVSSVGALLARTSELPNLRFTFTVLDTDTVNAFALPGGYVYITRGLLALANSEAEIAGVLAHEIGHVTARHAAQRHTRSVFAGLGAAAVGILTGSGELAQVAGTGLGAYVRSYSRGQEFEADKLGIRYLKRAGFDPGAMASFLTNLRAHARLDARLKGQAPDSVDEANFMSTHPRTLDRVRQAAAAAEGAPPRNPIVGREVYLDKIGAMVYGDSPEQGFVRGRDFLHPRLRIRFRVPPGFLLINQPSQVVAKGPRGALILFSAAPAGREQTPYRYLVNVWGRELRLFDLDRFFVNRLPAASGAARVRTRQGIRTLRLVAIRQGRRMYRFLFLEGGGGRRALDETFRETAFSFRAVSPGEARQWQPYRIRVVRARRGDTVERMARRMAPPRFKLERFRVLNGLGPRERLTPGRRVKIVVLGPQTRS